MAVACSVACVACGEHDQGHSLTAETEPNWAKLIHVPPEIFPRAPGGQEATSFDFPLTQFFSNRAHWETAGRQRGHTLERLKKHGSMVRRTHSSRTVINMIIEDCLPC